MRYCFGDFFVVLFFGLAFFYGFPHVAAETAVFSNYEIWNGEISDEINDIAISDDGHYIAAGSKDGTIYMIDQSGKLLWAYNNMRISSLGWKPDNGGDKWVSVSISGDGNYVAAGIWDLYRRGSDFSAISPKILFFDCTGKMLWTYPVSSVQDIGISSDGNIVAANADNRVLAFNRDGSLIWKIRSADSGGSISVSRNGSFIARTDDYEKISLVDSTGTIVWQEKVKNPFRYLFGKISKDGSVILVEGNGLFDKNGSLLWNNNELAASRWYGDLSSDGEYVVLGSDNGVMLTNRQGTILWTNNFTSSSPRIVAISDDGSVIGALPNGVHLHGEGLSLITNSGEIIWTADVSGYQGHMAISADGEYITTASRDTLYLFKKDRNMTNPPFSADLKSNVRYDWTSYLGEYLTSKYCTLDNLLIGLILIGFLSGIGYGLWRFKRYMDKKFHDDRFLKAMKYLVSGILIFVIAWLLESFLSHNYSNNIPLIMVGSPINSLLVIFSGIIVVVIPVITMIMTIASLLGYKRK
jgi:hypothetical protein